MKAKPLDQPGNREQGSDVDQPVVGFLLPSVSKLLGLLARHGGHGVDGPGLRGLLLQIPDLEIEEVDNPWETMNGDIPVAVLTRELCAYSTQGRWVDQEAGRREATHRRDATRVPGLLALSGRWFVGGNQKRGWLKLPEHDRKLSRLGRQTGDHGQKLCLGESHEDGTSEAQAG